MPRFAAIAFEGLPLEIARVRLALEPHPRDGSPDSDAFAVVVTHPGGAVQGESSLLGNTRLTEVSPRARAFGVRPGQTLAAAKAKLATLKVRVVEQKAVEAALVTVAELGLSFGATTAFEANGPAGDVVWVDVTGCAHLHASEADPEGERTLAVALGRAVGALGHACRVAVADGPKVAAAVARFAPRSKSVASYASYASYASGAPPLLVPPCGNARAMARLPLAALGLSPDTAAWLAKVGAHRVGDLQRLHRSALATRLHGDGPRVMALLEGDDRTPLRPHVPPVRPIERVVLEYGITHHEALFFVLKTLTDRLGARLEGRVKKAAKLLLRLEVDHAVAGAPDKDPALPITLASPLSKGDELFAVVRAKVESPDGAARIAIEREENGSMDVPILAATLEVTEEVAAAAVAQHLFVPEARADRALPRLVAELAADLGPTSVGVLSLVDTWVTAERSRLVPYKASPPPRTSPPLVSPGEEMSRLLPVPKVVPRAELGPVRLVSRSEQVEWWKPGGGARDSFVTFWDEPARARERGGEARVRGSAWVSIEARTGDACVEGWID